MPNTRQSSSGSIGSSTPKRPNKRSESRASTTSAGELPSIVLTDTSLPKYDPHHRMSGEVEIPLNMVEVAQTIEELHDLTANSLDEASQLGFIHFALRYKPTTGQLTVTVVEAKNLKKMDLGGLSDPYVKIALIQNGKRMKKKKTSIKKCTLNPHYNESFTFEVPYEQIGKTELLITVVDYDRIGFSDAMGGVLLGATVAGGREQRHWQDMLASPRRPVSQWHALKDNAALGHVATAAEDHSQGEPQDKK